MSPPTPNQFCRELASEIYLVTWTLYKLMIPALLVVKLLQEMGALAYLNWVVSPLMSLVGLPESMGIVWTTTIVTNIYAGMLVFYDLAQPETLSVAQVTVLCTLMLVCHGLPVEARIAQRAGVRLNITLLMLLLGAHVSGVIWFRLLFTLLALAIVTRWLNRRSDEFIDRRLFNKPPVPPRPGK
jgi:spore maturation protein SpmB